MQTKEKMLQLTRGGENCNLYSNKMKRHIHLPERLLLALVTGKEDHLPLISLRQPAQGCFEPVIIVQHEAVVKDQRHAVDPALDKPGGGQAESQVDLIRCAAAGLFQGDQLAAGIQERIEAFVNAYAGIDAAGDAADQIRGGLV